MVNLGTLKPSWVRPTIDLWMAAPTEHALSKNNQKMPLRDLTDTLTAITYRLATYMVNSVMDDPAMLAIIFC